MTKKLFSKPTINFLLIFLKIPVECRDVMEQPGADSLCSELSESCVILTLELFFCEALQKFGSFLEFKSHITWPGIL